MPFSLYIIGSKRILHISQVATLSRTVFACKARQGVRLLVHKGDIKFRPLSWGQWHQNYPDDMLNYYQSAYDHPTLHLRLVTPTLLSQISSIFKVMALALRVVAQQEVETMAGWLPSNFQNFEKAAEVRNDTLGMQHGRAG